MVGLGLASEGIGFGWVSFIHRSTYIMNKDEWYNLLSEIENLQIFSLCKYFDELSLEDNKGTSES